jgi:hypothetical protein
MALPQWKLKLHHYPMGKIPTKAQPSDRLNPKRGESNGVYTPADGSIFPARRRHELYHAAIIEQDNAKLSGRIAEGRRAILDRGKEILVTSGDERYFLNDALRSLLLLEAVAEREKRALKRRGVGSLDARGNLTCSISNTH